MLGELDRRFVSVRNSENDNEICEKWFQENLSVFYVTGDRRNRERNVESAFLNNGTVFFVGIHIFLE